MRVALPEGPVARREHGALPPAVGLPRSFAGQELQVRALQLALAVAAILVPLNLKDLFQDLFW